MSYQEYVKVLRELYDLSGIKLGLNVMSGLLHVLGDPGNDYPIVLVGGTNGKGSTVSMLSSILREAGYRVGTFTKPHLCRFTERIAVNGVEITQGEVVDLYHEIMGARDSISTAYERMPTFFETSVAMAYKQFANKGVDVAVVEVGMGGRLDATNACNHSVSLITNVSLEHTQHLGDTVEKIAFEKAGIVQSGRTTITACSEPALHVVKERCDSLGSTLIVVPRDFRFDVIRSDIEGTLMNMEGLGISVSRVELRLIGKFQATNAALATVASLETSRALGHASLEESTIRRGLGEAIWPGRLEIIQTDPLVVLDCAKDPAASEALTSALREIVPGRSFTTVASISSDKDYRGMLHHLCGISDTFVLTRHSVMGRALPIESMAEVLDSFGAKYVSEDKVRAAVARAISIAGARGNVLVTGSVFTVGEARPIWSDETSDGF